MLVRIFSFAADILLDVSLTGGESQPHYQRRKPLNRLHNAEGHCGKSDF